MDFQFKHNNNYNDFSLSIDEKSGGGEDKESYRTTQTFTLKTVVNSL